MAHSKSVLKSKRRNPKVGSDKVDKEKVPESGDHQPENSFDFGGIPSRNLKKNLGCG